MSKTIQKWVSPNLTHCHNMSCITPGTEPVDCLVLSGGHKPHVERFIKKSHHKSGSERMQKTTNYPFREFCHLKGVTVIVITARTRRRL
jgi:hypothetical protein